MRIRTLAIAALAALGLAGPAPARAQGEVVVYCSVLVDWCNLMAQEFTRATGVRVTMNQKGSGESFAQIRAEAANPRGDVWWGGTGDPHLQAAEAGLTEEYRSPTLPQLHDWAQRQAQQSGFRTVGIYAGALGFTYNTQALARGNMPEPRCWRDLLQPQFRGEIQMSNPPSSGTAYTVLATLVQLWGEDEAFAYLRRLHPQINQYTRSGPAPARNAARGETTVGIMFLHDAVAEALEGSPLRVVAPCEGTGYEIGSMSIIKDARNLENAKKFYDWALTPAPQSLGAQNKQLQTPSNKSTPMPKMGVDLSTTKLINYDFAKYGSSAERNRLLAKWDKEVKSQPK